MNEAALAARRSDDTLELRPVPPGGRPRRPRRETLELPVQQDPVDFEILRILEGSMPRGETIDAVFTQRERALMAVFEGLDRAAASRVYRRLSRPQQGDRIAAAFLLLIPERRGRLLSFLAGAERGSPLRPPRQP